MTQDEIVELNEARLMDTWGTWAARTRGQVGRWIAARTQAQARAYAHEMEWQWYGSIVVGQETRHLVRSGKWKANSIDVVLY